ncbi:hypothetical protein DYL61_09330 [Pseudomonas nabeulensis]|uniref:Uncharacterized protein n=1 Tax=Pseudomonas nabeulensis TaxID=2293833 RepID=A0A4Z0B5Q0_9PSED|nr:hypothetical protein DYL61_09330 [Pseudomonas nabeulensis]
MSGLLWRGSLLPLGCEAAPIWTTEIHPLYLGEWLGSAAHSSGSKLPRHMRTAPKDEQSALEQALQSDL